VAVEPPRKRCSPSWARLIAKVYQVDPLVCTGCGRRMSIVAFLTDSFAIRRILDHLGLSTPKRKNSRPCASKPNAASMARECSDRSAATAHRRQDSEAWPRL
jgi:hypothetical protein